MNSVTQNPSLIELKTRVSLSFKGRRCSKLNPKKSITL